MKNAQCIETQLSRVTKAPTEITALIQSPSPMLVGCLSEQPSMKRARDMVRMTAAKCMSAPQLEVLLKVKQANNPDFAFLNPNNECHAYYLWLKEEQERKRKEEESVAKAGGLSLLEMYSSSSEDEESTTAQETNSQLKTCETRATMTHTTQEEDAINAPNGAGTLPVNATGKRSADNKAAFANDGKDEEKKARRLKRAKLMRGHYRLRLMEGESNGGSKSSG